MSILNNDHKPVCRKFCYDHWRYCEPCEKCDKNKEQENKKGEDDFMKRFDRFERDDCFEEDERFENDRPDDKCKPKKQAHVHEFLGSTKLAEEDDERHNHRFAGVSGEAIKIPGSHVHKIWTRTDFFDHFHFINKFTGPAIPVDVDKSDDCDCKKKKVEHHVHFVEGFTTVEDNHKHEFELATLIESPLLPLKDEDIR